MRAPRAAPSTTATAALTAAFTTRSRQAELRRAFLESEGARAAGASDDEADGAGAGGSGGAGGRVAAGGGLLAGKRLSAAEEQAEAAALAADREALRRKLAAKRGGVAQHADELADPRASSTQ